MKKLFLLIMIFTPLTILAAPSYLVKCVVKNTDWEAIFRAVANDTGSLQFQKTGNKNTYHCELKSDDIYDGRRSVVPNVRFHFQRGYCNPELNELEEVILEQFTLIVGYPEHKKTTGRVQWLEHKQPDQCTVEILNLQEIAARTKKQTKKKASETKSR